MIRVTEIAFVAYPVNDVKRAREFYEGVLGLKSTHVFEQGPAAWIEYDIGAGTLAITTGTPTWRPSPQGGAAGLEVEDFDAAIAALREKGARFVVEPFQTPVCRMAVIADPDGSPITIHKRNAP